MGIATFAPKPQHTSNLPYERGLGLAWITEPTGGAGQAGRFAPRAFIEQSDVRSGFSA